MSSLTSLFGDDAVILRERNFQVLLLASVLPPLGLALVSPVLDSLVDPLHTSAANIGLMMSVFTAPAIVIIPIAGVLADRIGRKPILVVSLVLFGAGGMAIAFLTDYRVVLASRFIQGIAFGGLVPIIITSIGDLYAGGREATGQGFRFMVAGLSGAFIPLVAGVLVTLAWYYPFLIYALALPVSALMYLWFDEPTQASTSPATDGGDARPYSRALLNLLRQRRVLAMVISRTLLTGTWIGFLTYNSIIVVRVIGGTPPQSGMLVAVGYFVFAVTASQAGRITAIFQNRLYLLIGANVCTGVGFAVLLFAPQLVVAAVGVVVLGFGIGLLGSLYRSIITGLAPEYLRAGLVSLSEMGGQLTNTVTPVAMGGIIALVSPTVGFVTAIRFAGLAVTVTAVAGSVICLLVASAAAPVSVDRPEGAGI